MDAKATNDIKKSEFTQPHQQKAEAEADRAERTFSLILRSILLCTTSDCLYIFNCVSTAGRRNEGTRSVE